MTLPIALPIRYRLEMFETVNGSQPLAVWNASTPFHSIHVGDYVNPSAWADAGSLKRPLEPGQALRVKSIVHLLCEITNSYVGHTLSAYLERVPSEA